MYCYFNIAITADQNILWQFISTHRKQLLYKISIEQPIIDTAGAFISYMVGKKINIMSYHRIVFPTDAFEIKSGSKTWISEVTYLLNQLIFFTLCFRLTSDRHFDTKQKVKYVYEWFLNGNFTTYMAFFYYNRLLMDWLWRSYCISNIVLYNRKFVMTN